MEIKQRIAREIRRLMAKRGITQADMARRLGKSRQNINRMLSGKENLSLDSLVRIGLAMGCDLNVDLLKPDAPLDYAYCLNNELCIAA